MHARGVTLSLVVAWVMALVTVAFLVPACAGTPAQPTPTASPTPRPTPTPPAYLSLLPQDARAVSQEDVLPWDTIENNSILESIISADYLSPELVRIVTEESEWYYFVEQATVVTLENCQRWLQESKRERDRFLVIAAGRGGFQTVFGAGISPDRGRGTDRQYLLAWVKQRVQRPKVDLDVKVPPEAKPLPDGVYRGTLQEPGHIVLPDGKVRGVSARWDGGVLLIETTSETLYLVAPFSGRQPLYARMQPFMDEFVSRFVAGQPKNVCSFQGRVLTYEVRPDMYGHGRKLLRMVWTCPAGIGAADVEANAIYRIERG